MKHDSKSVKDLRLTSGRDANSWVDAFHAFLAGLDTFLVALDTSFLVALDKAFLVVLDSAILSQDMAHVLGEIHDAFREQAVAWELALALELHAVHELHVLELHGYLLRMLSSKSSFHHLRISMKHVPSEFGSGTLQSVGHL